MYHYEDNFFIIDGLVRVIHDASSLETDPEIIGDTLLAMIRLADASLRKVKEMVFQNTRMINRPENLRLLANTAQRFSEALDEFTRPDTLLSKSFSSSRDEILRMLTTHKAAVKEMREALLVQNAGETSFVDHVSGDELSELLREPS